MKKLDLGITGIEIFKDKRDDMTLYFICSDIVKARELNSILLNNKFLIKHSKNEFGEYNLELLFIDTKQGAVIETKWTNEIYPNFECLDRNTIFFVNTAIKTENGFQLDDSRRIGYVNPLNG